MDGVSTSATYAKRFTKQNAARHYATRFETGARRRIHQRELRAVRRVLGLLPECRSLADVPCGAGRFLSLLTGGGRSLTAIDVAEPILELARQRAAEEGLHVQFVHGSAAALSLGDSSVDCVFSNRLLHHLKTGPERARVLREFCRVSRRFVIVSFFDYHAFGFLRRCLKRLKGRKPDYSSQPTFSEFVAEARQAGLELRKVVRTGWPWTAQRFLLLERLSAASAGVA